MATMFAKLVSLAYSPRYLLTTNTATMCLIYGTGDVIVQLVDSHRQPPYTTNIDWKRVFRVGAIGMLHGPMNHFWYGFLDRAALRGSQRVIVAKKVASDLAASPAFAVAFVTGLTLLEGNSIREALLEYKQKFIQIFTLDACVWPPAQAINFWLVPPAFRVLFVSAVVLVYSGLFSAIRHDDHEPVLEVL
uniref:Mpv17-like protein 2 n=1 Tax=Panagrellus redivivus TaxID=6233 RepID=A0A7E4VPW4_PANRE